MGVGTMVHIRKVTSNINLIQLNFRSSFNMHFYCIVRMGSKHSSPSCDPEASGKQDQGDYSLLGIPT